MCAKKEKIEHFLALMQKEGITLRDMLHYATDLPLTAQEMADWKNPQVQASAQTVVPKKSEGFELLCDYKSWLVRCSYAEVFQDGDKPKMPILGVFPFAGDPHYLGLTETPEVSYRTAQTRNLVPLCFWERIFAAGILPQLNELFRKLDAPIIEGLYLAGDPNEIGWSVRFREGQKTLDADYYGAASVGKVRSYGILPA